MSGLAQALTAVRDETHRMLSKVADDFRAAERDYGDKERAAAARVDAAEKAAASAVTDAAAASRQADVLRSHLDASEQSRSSAEASAAKRIATLEIELAATAPAREQAEKNAAALQKDMRALEHRVMEAQRKHLATEDKLSVAELARSEAERHEGMFRRALFTYLQERDGPAGSSAPTPETLKQIRELLTDGA